MRSRGGGEETSNRNYVWVRTDLVIAIWENHGTLPKNYQSSRKRGRGSSSPSWGWCRAYIVQSSAKSSNLYNTSSSTSTSRLHSRTTNNTNHNDKKNNDHHASRTILVTLTVDDTEFAPSHLNQATVSFSYDSGDQETVCNANTWWNTREGIPPDDLTSLTHLHEPSVVYCLQQHYQQDGIYTYTGQILLALNPFRVLDGLYGEHIMEQYWQPNQLERPPPHIYAIAQDAYRSMMHMGENQSILVSGESGAGKTVTTKIIMGYLATCSRRLVSADSQGIESQILQSNPILESFGNARTIRNDNSSRFGKFMELLFTGNGSLVSASIETYLLEKVRLISQAPGERNYHVFYEVLAGVPQKQRRELHIANVTARDFKMTALSGTFDRRDGVDDRDTYKDLRQALDTVGFTATEQQDMLSVVCALLHTGNLTFSQASGDGSELVSSNPSLRSVIALLGVPVEALNNALCLYSIEARGEIFYKNMSVEQANKAVQALIKATYAALFTHIVRRVNTSIAMEHRPDVSPDQLASIGVLDIFGFESFDKNSYEQLCINYCNEALQQQFNRFVFKLEQKEYEQEGIKWSFISFPDNQEVLDLIEKKHDGILSILDEQCRLQTSTEESLCRAVYNKCQNHTRFSATNTQKAQLEFSIHHYAGLVTYDSYGFLEKNKDELPKETTELLMSSSFDFLASLGEILNQGPSISGVASPSNGNRAPSPTLSSVSSTNSWRGGPSPNKKQLNRGSSSLKRESVGSQFNQQLRELRNRIDSTTPHYVRCLKPNDDLIPDRFEPHIIADQLRCAGVLEAIRVSRVGFPHRYFHDYFFQRYGILAKASLSRRQSGEEGCIVLIRALFPQILEVLKQDGAGDGVSGGSGTHEVVSLGMQMGRTKVFLRRRIFEALEFLRNTKLGLSAIFIQSHVRRLLAQLQLYDSLYAVVTLQCFARQKAAKRRYIERARYDSAVKIQCAWRRFLAETEIFAARLIAFFCQSYRRGAIARELCSILRVEHQSLVLQRCWRRHYRESYYSRLRKATIIAQCLWRQKVAIRTVKYLRREAKDVGKIAAERDRFKEESARLKKEVERLKRSKQGHSDPNSGEVERLKKEVERLQTVLADEDEVERLRKGVGRLQTVSADEDEVERLREEVERLQTVLAKTSGLLGSSIDIARTPETSKSSTKWSLSGVFGKKDETSSQVSTGSFSPMPTIRRALFIGDRDNGTPENAAGLKQRLAEVTPTPSRSRTFYPGMPSSSSSLLDTEEMMRPVDDTLYTVPTASTTMGSGIMSVPNPNDSLDTIDLNPAPVSERRGQQFSKELHYLHDVVLANNLPLVKDILRQSDEHHVLINEIGANGRTALHAAVLSSNFKIARILIEKGAIVNTQDFDGDTPLHLAEGAPMTTLLLEEGKANPNIPNIDGICALHIAVQRRDAGSVRMLLQHGAKVDTADNEKWLTPLHVAALPDKPEQAEIEGARMRSRTIITSLLCARNNGSYPDLNDQDHEGNSPLHYAAQIETPEACDVLNLFLEKGADPRLCNSRNQHPLLLLCHNHALRKHDVFQDCLHSMLFHGADPNKQSTTGCTALHLSLYHRDMDSAVQLVNRGAELHLVWKKPKRWTAFWEDDGTSEVLPLDMVLDDHSLHRILAAITKPTKWAPVRPFCMQCRTQLGTVSRAIHCRHCGRNVCGACSRGTLSPDYFPKSFEIFEASWACIVCEKILIARKEDNSSSTHPISSIGDDDEGF